MTKVGVVGSGNMGSGLAKSLIATAFETHGFDPDPPHSTAFTEMGGHACASVGAVGQMAHAVFVMVMTGAQAAGVILGKDRLRATM